MSFGLLLSFIDFLLFNSSKPALNGEVQRLTEGKEIDFAVSLLELFFLLHALCLFSEGSA